MSAEAQVNSHRLLPYLVTVAVVSAVALLKVLMQNHLDINSPFILFYTAVIASAWYGGRRQGFLATLLSFIFAYTLFIYHQPLVGGPDTYGARFILFGSDCVIVTLLCSAMREARIKAELALVAFRSAQALSRENQLRFNRVYESNMIGLMTAKTNGIILDCND